MKEENVVWLIALAMILAVFYALFKDKDELVFSHSNGDSTFKFGGRKLPSNNHLLH